MVRAPFVDENGLKKGAWSVEEDNKLRSYIQRYGHWNWRELPRFAGLARCGKSCRLRWINYLQPNIKHGSYTKEEQELVIKLHQQFGNRWSKIAKSLPGRTDNEVKNYWHTRLKKRVMHQQSTTNKTRKGTLTKKSQSKNNSQVDDNSNSLPKFSETNNLHILESCPLSPQRTLSTVQSCNNSLNSETSITNDQYQHNNVESDIIIEQTFRDEGSSNNIDNTQSIRKLTGEVLDPPFWTEPFSLETYQECYDDANSKLIHDGLFSPTNLSSYWEMMDFSCILDTDVNMQCTNEVETNYW